MYYICKKHTDLWPSAYRRGIIQYLGKRKAYYCLVIESIALLKIATTIMIAYTRD